LKTSDIQQINKQKIKNIIFDWGGVITNINYQSTIDAFSALGFENFSEFFTHDHQKDIFKLFEVGKIEPGALRDEIRKFLPGSATDNQIDTAWCAMLRDTPNERLELINKLRGKFKLYLLSNTNQIHADYCMSHLIKTSNINFLSLFEKIYLSHQIHLRKPNREIYEYVLSDSKLIPSETLFVDDTEINTDVASTLGIQSFYLKPDIDITGIFKDWI
jgi:glucose-1-phosphatase